MKITDTKTNWLKAGDLTCYNYIAKETICFGASGCHLLFVNIFSGEQTIFTANSSEMGDGILQFAGHSSLNIFAYTANCLNPRIFIRTFPDFQLIRVLENGSPEGYLRIAFSETAVLMSLGDLPNFEMIAWNWKLGTKMATAKSSVRFPQQRIRCSLGSPLYVAQVGVRTQQLCLWDVFVYSHKSMLVEHVIKVPKEFRNLFTKVMWNSENTMFVLDSRGCVYAVHPTKYHLEKIIDCSAEGDFTASFTWFRGGFAVCGPNNEVRHYKKSGSWTRSWSIEPSQPINFLCARSDHLFAITRKQNYVEILTEQNEMRFVHTGSRKFKDFCLVYPTGRYIVALCYEKELAVFKVATGEQVSSMVLPHPPLKMAENPHFPYIAVGYSNGIVDLISVYNPKKMEKITSFHLTKNPIDGIYFNSCGRVFVAADLAQGEFFVLEGLPGGEISVIATVNAHWQIAAFAMVLSQDCYRIFTVPVTSDKYVAGNKIVRYCIIKGEGTRVKEYEFEDEKVLYGEIHTTSKMNRDRVLYGVPLSSRHIHEIEVKRGNSIGKITKVIPTGHQLKEVHLNLTNKFALTWSYDGLVILRCSEFTKPIGFGMPHHRMSRGVKKAYVDPYNKFIVSLGRENMLVCTELLDYEIEPGLRDELKSRLRSVAYNELFKKPTVGFMPEGEWKGLCWLEVEEIKRTEKERIECLRERNAILKSFKEIQRELQELLTKNLEGPENEYLDLIEFNLDEPLYARKVEENKEMCEATDAYLRDLIKEQNRVAKWMKETFLDGMKVPRVAIKGIFANFEVENFVVLKDRQDFLEKLAYSIQRRELEDHLSEGRPFQPWLTIPENELLANIKKRPQYDDTKLKTMRSLEEHIMNEEMGGAEKTELLEHDVALTGSEMVRFIEIDPHRYTQCQVQAHRQTETQSNLVKNDKIRLQEWFNQKFEVMMAQKAKDMSIIAEKNARLRHIISELNFFAKEKMNLIIIDPEWDQEENPEQLLKVSDSELSITPYISPSEQAILDAKAAEAERLRLLLLADDFKERALMKMMNGVLEVRWEDELKKDVPIPKCMIEKQPETFNEDDLRAVRDYEEKVRVLEGERVKYQRLLHVEYYKVKNQVKETIRKFNERLRNLQLLKLKVSVAMNQESMMMYRLRLRARHRHTCRRDRAELKESMKENEKEIKHLHELLADLQEGVVEAKNHYETVQARDKNLDKAFRKEIQDMSLVVQEHATKIYKRRPKLVIRGLINSMSTLNDLARCVMTKQTMRTLSTDCLEFLRSLEQLDQYVGVPAPIDEHIFQLICKHRRQRIEYEIKCKAASIAVTNAETVYSIFSKRLVLRKELHTQLSADLAKAHEDILAFRLNMEIQLSVSQGIVEIPKTGSMNDYDDAIVVNRKEIEEINKIILEHGNKKLQSMKQTMAFRRKIMELEWEHQRLRMQIEDLKLQITDIQGIKVTKEMQAFLKAKKRGFADKACPTFESEMEMLRMSYENQIRDLRMSEANTRRDTKILQENTHAIDKKIIEINVEVCEVNLMKDPSLEQREKNLWQNRMNLLLKRSKLAEQIQINHSEILVLQTELELLRLRTFPTLKYKVCN